MRENGKKLMVAAAALAVALGAANAEGDRRGKGGAREPVLGTRLAATALLAGKLPESWLQAAGGNEPPRSLEWPVSGQRIDRGFVADNGRHKAIDIRVEAGTPVRAMADGIVGYASSGVRGYGNLVLLLHPGGWVTLYAHLERMEVEPGQRVERGSIVAFSGSTGASSHPHLHFALLVRGKAVDPTRYMPRTPDARLLLTRFASRLVPGAST